MNLGIFAKTYGRSSLETCFDAVRNDGLSVVQLKMTQVGLPTLPEEIPQTVIDRIRRAADRSGIEIVALSATFNMAHPDREHRRDGLRRLPVLARAARVLGVPFLSLCSGTRHPVDIWAYHPDNQTDAAWADTLASMQSAVGIAESIGVKLGVEPEAGNIITDAADANRLMTEIASDALGAIFDPANLLIDRNGTLCGVSLEESRRLLGDRLWMVHGKDTTASGQIRPPGKGIVDWSVLLHQLHDTGFDGPVLLHGFPETEVSGAVAYLAPIIAGFC